ncbi:peptidase inhibitor family I36 protein [Micromonospora cathayae]|uniref:Peptidase inhibitor family I36 protein n=1 Tax=Micromonospora cathayae TaxID=3028804 RepID=A0ABY8A1G9_9ACTN|nr:peptidase inhibitor family I36 protein [Micromonospora sp. HUAS 3]WDZ87834.1 peptidase inhibitor family I36 protein [Micromonospora sp. HUAS 3]
MIRRVSRLALLVSMVGVLLAGGLAGPAGAAPRSEVSAAVQSASVDEPVGVLASCGAAGYACFWVGGGFTGTRGRVAGNNPNYRYLSNSSGCTKAPGTWNDCISSIRNDGTQCTVYFWTDADYHGRYHSLSRGDQVGNFSGAPYYDAAFNDAISSNHWCTPN